MSAFGTCGLSLGVTDNISSITKVVLMLLMFIGRVGLISFIIMISGRKEPDKFSYQKRNSNWITKRKVGYIHFEFVIPLFLYVDSYVLNKKNIVIEMNRDTN